MVDMVSYLNAGLTTSSGKNDTKASKEMSKDAFMQLLVTQMTHQNPLEPMDNNEFIGQLAQFSALELQQNIASAIELMALTQQASTNSQMVDLIGKRVIVPGSGFSLDGKGEKPVTLRFEMTDKETPTALVVKNSKGETVRNIDLANLKAGVNEVQFDGKDSNGNLLEAGQYSYQLVDAQGKALTKTTTYSNYLVESVAFEGTEILLKSGGVTVNLDEIREVLKG